MQIGPKLTPLQVETLRLIAQGKVRMVNTGTASYRIFGASPTVVGRLVQSLRLARWPLGPTGNQTCGLTDAGSATLAQIDGAP